MATQLPALESQAFRERLEQALSGRLSDSIAESLLAHYTELRRWAARTALVGSGEAGEIVERHYAQSLAALPLLGTARTVLDLGSGAGFPGWILAAAEPGRDFWLFESRQRKVSFLRAAASRAKLSCKIVDARVSRRQTVLGALEKLGAADIRFEIVTVRAVRVDQELWDGVKPALGPGARALRWEGEGGAEPWPGAEPGRSISLPGGSGRIREWLLPDPTA